MPSLVCPHCGVYANFRHRWSREYPDDATMPWEKLPPAACFTCDRCEYPIAAITVGFSNTLESYWPTKAMGKSFPDVPGEIAVTANEAHLCLSADSPRGAVALARAVVESVAKHKSIVKGTLQTKIDALYTDGHISEAMKEAAHEIRFAGNEAAHGDLVAEPLTAEDAEEIVSLMDTILERVYQEPAQVARIRQQRESRKRATASQSEAETTDEPPF